MQICNEKNLRAIKNKIQDPNVLFYIDDINNFPTEVIFLDFKNGITLDLLISLILSKIEVTKIHNNNNEP
jgi:hypothetical protein